MPCHRYTYDHLTAPTCLAGLSQPLKSLYLTNLAALLLRRDKATPAPPQPDPDRITSPRISEHDGEAFWALSFKHYTESDPPSDQSQKQIYNLLHKADGTPRIALAAKLNPPGGRIGKKAAEELAQTIHTNSATLPSRLPPSPAARVSTDTQRVTDTHV